MSIITSAFRSFYFGNSAKMTPLCIRYAVVILLHSVAITISSASDDVDSFCDGDWHRMNESVYCDHYFSPSMAIQTFRVSPDVASFTRMALSIEANYDVIITPHCVSLELDVNPSTMSHLSREWILQNVEWPRSHSVGELITFRDGERSHSIQFADSCSVTPNGTNALILMFNTDFRGYDIEVISDPECNHKVEGITVYDALYEADCHLDDGGDHEIFPIESAMDWNMAILNGSGPRSFSLSLSVSSSVTINEHK